MIVRLRLRAGLYLSALLAFVGVSLAAQATQTVTRSEMEAFVYSTMAVAGLATLGGGAGVIAWILARDRSLQREHLAQIITAISELATGLNRAVRALEQHDDDPYAHRAASEHNHGPMDKKLDALDRKVDAILLDCEGRACSGRDPSASPSRRRATDPDGADHTPERGSR